MYITKIENFGKSKLKIYIDEEYRFWIYSREIKKLSINEDEEISAEKYNKLYKLNLSRAKRQVMNILQRMDKTKHEIITKLKQAGHNDDIISETLVYIDGYNYIDDEKYARQYVRYKRDNLSKREIVNKLLIKGVSKEVAMEAILDEYESEETAIIKAINKRRRTNQELSEDDKRKLSASLYRKGFELDSIRKHIEDFEA